MQMMTPGMPIEEGLGLRGLGSPKVGKIIAQNIKKQRIRPLFYILLGSR